MFYGIALDESKKAKLEEAMGWYEAVLKNHSYAAGQTFTLADISLCVTVSQIEAFKFNISPYPRMRAWLTRCKQDLAPYGYEVRMIYVIQARSAENYLYSFAGGQFIRCKYLG